MSKPAQHPDDFTAAFDTAFARLQIRIETACLTEIDWPDQVAAGIQAALAFAAADPAAAQVLTSGAMSGGRVGFARYDRMLAHFSGALLPGRAERPEGGHLPEITEKAMVGGLATLISQRLDLDRNEELTTIAAEAIQFVLTPYLGTEEARRVAAEAA